MIPDSDFTTVFQLKIYHSFLGWHYELINKYGGVLASDIQPSFADASRVATSKSLEIGTSK